MWMSFGEAKFKHLLKDAGLLLTKNHVVGVFYKDNKGNVKTAVYDHETSKTITLKDAVEKTAVWEQITQGKEGKSVAEMYDNKVNEKLDLIAKSSKERTEFENAIAFKDVISKIECKFLLSQETVNKVQKLQDKIRRIEQSHGQTQTQFDNERTR